MASGYGFTVKLDPPDPGWKSAPEADRRAYYKRVVELVKEQKDRDLAAGLDRFGAPMVALAPATIAHRHSDMGPADPNAPPLTPAHALSRTRALFDGRAFADHAEFFWRDDRFSGLHWGKVLGWHREGAGHLPVRDVIGISRQSLDAIRPKAHQWWSLFKHGKAIGAATKKLEVATGATGPAKLKVIGYTDVENFTFGINTTKAETEAAIAAGQHSGFFQFKPGTKQPIATAPPFTSPHPEAPPRVPKPEQRRPAPKWEPPQVATVPKFTSPHPEVAERIAKPAPPPIEREYVPPAPPPVPPKKKGPPGITVSMDEVLKEMAAKGQDVYDSTLYLQAKESLLAKKKAAAAAKGAATRAANAAKKKAEAEAAAKAAQPETPAPAPIGPEFPHSPEGLKVVKSLGGSTGAELVEDARGNLWVRKRGSSPEHLREEATADQAYLDLGQRVPRFRLYETDRGPVKLAQFIEGRTLADARKADPALAQRAEADLRRGFAVDAMMGNWDVVGLSADNVLVDDSGNAWRIDNGGALRFRAQGGRKTAAQWNDYPTELWTMRDKAKNEQAARVYGTMGIGEVAAQIRQYRGESSPSPEARRMLLNLPEGLRATVAARLHQLGDVAKTAETFLGDKFVDSYADGIAKHQIGIRAAGIVDRMPTRLDNKGVVVKDQDGRPWDHLRGKDSLVKSLEDYLRAQGLDYTTVSKWMSSQADSSWSRGSQALKHALAQARGGQASDYYWRDGAAVAADSYRIVTGKAGGEQRYLDTMRAIHSFTREYLTKADFSTKNADGTVTLLRTEPDAPLKAAGLKPGMKGVTMRRGACESTSVFEWVTVYGSEKTVQRVPIHRVIGTYFQERFAGHNEAAFMSDRENEFVAVLEGIPFDYLK
jgi:hypothetical protein